MIRKIEKIFLLSVFLIISVSVQAQEGAYGAYSPYSIYGIGDISKEGTAFNKSMGGTGIAARNNRYINYLNPAAVTARDTLSFMADFGLSQSNKMFAQGDLRSGNNTFNIYDFVMTFPIWRSSAFMVGITPYSDVGYDFSSIETNPEIIGNVGNLSYDSYGTGSIYQAFVGAGVTFWKKLSVGAELIYYFGNVDKITNLIYSDSSYRSMNSGSELSLDGVTGKFGLQYEHNIKGNVSMILGATYKMGTGMKGYSTNFRYANQSGIVDTLKYSVDTLARSGMKFGDELGLGISFKGGDKWSAEFNYIRSDWRKSGMDTAPGFAVTGDSKFTASVSNSFRAGFEIVPNRNDIRHYFNRCAYRAGMYYDNAYYKLDGNSVNSMGITFGMTLPIENENSYRKYNGITLGVDIGQKASVRNKMIRERYVMFVIGFNIHDLWFIKNQYQ
ncbi:MAG: hypothetical protein J6R15_00195 [Bacteroidales bacterium]|jgi:hypothetical protein|nr:hypothetical protein [Bacteroidales bacterium]